MAKMKLFCVPYAGGSATAYFKWGRLLQDVVDLKPIELAGRGRRFGEPHYGDIMDAVDDVFNIIKDDIKLGSYALYGHSMGSVIVYELCRKINREGLPAPVHVFFSGRSAPHVPEKKKIHGLPENEFNAEIMKYNGTPKELFDNEELMSLFMPLLRADFKLIESYEYVSDGLNLPYNITVLNGYDDDELTMEEIGEWKDHTSGECKILMFDGGHFFINEKMEAVIDVIKDVLG